MPGIGNASQILRRAVDQPIEAKVRSGVIHVISGVRLALPI
jgi:hypothetical protein